MLFTSPVSGFNVVAALCYLSLSFLVIIETVSAQNFWQVLVWQVAMVCWHFIKPLCFWVTVFHKDCFFNVLFFPHPSWPQLSFLLIKLSVVYNWVETSSFYWLLLGPPTPTNHTVLFHVCLLSYCELYSHHTPLGSTQHWHSDWLMANMIFFPCRSMSTNITTTTFNANVFIIVMVLSEAIVYLRRSE